MPSSSEIDSSVSRCKRIVAPFRVSSYRCLIERAWLSGRRIWLQGTIAKIDPQKFSICAKHRRLMLPVHVHGATAKFNFFPPIPFLPSLRTQTAPSFLSFFPLFFPFRSPCNVFNFNIFILGWKPLKFAFQISRQMSLVQFFAPFDVRSFQSLSINLKVKSWNSILLKKQSNLKFTNRDFSPSLRNRSLLSSFARKSTNINSRGKGSRVGPTSFTPRTSKAKRYASLSGGEMERIAPVRWTLFGPWITAAAPAAGHRLSFSPVSSHRAPK